MVADFSYAGNDCILESGRFLVFRQLRGVRSNPCETEHIHTGHIRIQFIEGAGADQGIKPLARADLKMKLAMRAYLQILVELLVEDHGAALGALGPKTLGDFTLSGFT